MRQFERDFCIAIRVAARTTPVERETAFIHGKNSVFGPTSARKIDRIASVLPDDVLAIIFEKYDNSFQKEKMKRVLRELVYVTSYIKYGFCGKQDCKCCKRLFRQRKSRGQVTFLSWTYLDPDRDHVVEAFDPLFDFYSSDDGSDDNGAGDGDNAGDAGDAGHAYLIRGHGLYTWAADIGACYRQLEALETLLAVELDRRRLG